MRDHNEFGKFGEKKRHNSLGGIKQRKYFPYKKKSDDYYI